jgi:hypothetical protein
MLRFPLSNHKQFVLIRLRPKLCLEQESSNPKRYFARTFHEIYVRLDDVEFVFEFSKRHQACECTYPKLRKRGRVDTKAFNNSEGDQTTSGKPVYITALPHLERPFHELHTYTIVKAVEKI